MALIRPTNPTIIKELAEKQKKLKKTEPAMKKGGSIMVRIQNICEAVQKRLGHYKDHLELIQTKERLHEYITSAIEKDIISIDTETTGLDPITDQIVGACIYTRGEKPAYIPINHIDYITGVRVQNQLTEKEVAEEFQRLVVAKTKAIFFNAKFDIRVMRWQLGVNIPPAHCGFIAGKCLKEDEPEGNLKFLWKKYCCPPDFEEPALTFDKMFEGLKFNLIPISTAYLYAAKDALMTLDLYDFQIEYLDENNPKCQACHLEKVAKLYREIELPIISIVADIEDQGVVIDADYGEKLSKEYNQKLKEAEEEFVKELSNYQSIIDDYMAQHPESKLESPVNINSPTQLSELFYKVLKQPVVSKKDPEGTGKEILKAMGHPLCKPILAYKEIAKLVSTYIDNLPKMVNKKTGRLHCSFNQYGAACCTYDTLIATNKGIFKIGELVNSLNTVSGEFADADITVINKERNFERANKVIKYENVDTIKVKGLYGFEIEGTPNHKVIVSKITESDWNKNHSEKQKRNFWSEKYFKQLDKIQIGDYIEVPCGWEYPYIPLIPVPYEKRELKTHNKRELKIPKYFDETFAEFLGMYHADGSIKDKEGFTLQISNADNDVIKRVKELCLELFNIEGTYYSDKRTNGGVTIFRVSHADSLKPIFCRGANNKRIPEIIKHSNENVIKAYIRGMTLDSTVQRGRIRMTISNKLDAQFIQFFLCSQGILSCVKTSKHQYKNGGELYYVIVSGDYLNKFLDNIGVVQSRKNIRNVDKQEHYKNVLLDNSFRIRVTDIEYSKNDVYDLHVPGTHSYLSNSMISHNTGRFSCIAEGTPIRLVGEEKPIEEVKVGDLVYCYDEEGKLRIRKVTKTWDIGMRPCLDIKWQSSGTGRIGHLICTENHEIKTKKYGWVCAKDLSRYTKMYHLSSKIQKNGRIRLSGTNKYDELEEQCIKREYFNADSCMHIHHIDENKSNNKIDNLRVLSASEHTSMHGKERYEKGEIKAEWMLKHRPEPRYGKEHPMFKDISVEDLKQMVHDVKGKIREVPLDFETFKRKCKEYNFDYREVAAQYNNRYIKLTRESVLDALEKTDGKMTKAMKLLGVGYIAFTKFCKNEGIEYNHMVQSITPIGERHVYDIEVEDFHNFIANEICVHNSSNPNFQNLPSKNHDIRLMFTAAKEAKVDVKDGKFSLYIEDLVPTVEGDKNSQDLKAGDILVCEDGKFLVKQVEINDVFVDVFI